MPRTRSEDNVRRKNVLNSRRVNGQLFWQRNASRGVSS